MPEQEAGADEVRNRAADIRLTRYPDAQTDFAVDRALGFSRIRRKDTLPFKLTANAFLEGLAPRISVAHGRQRIAEPVADRYLFAFVHDERTRAAIGTGSLGNEV
jgi:hypothetical protein